MFHPVGSEPPSVYWRRRLLLLAAAVLVIVLLVLTFSAVLGGGGGKPAAGSSITSQSTRPSITRSSSPAAPPTSAAASTSAPAAPTSKTSSSGASHSTSTSAMPKTCALGDLKLTALVGKHTYKVGDQPLLQLEVENVGTAPCERDLADKQIVLRVYNGSSRVWGSHDCAVQPGTDVRTLAVDKPYRFAILWGGLSSTPKCDTATRQRVGAGSYTLYASLAGRNATAAQFDIN